MATVKNTTSTRIWGSRLAGLSRVYSHNAILFISLFLSLCHTEVRAHSVDYVFGLATGYALFTFPQKLDSEPAYQAYVLSGAVSHDAVYVSYRYVDSINEARLSEEEDIGRASRRDNDITVGYRINESFSLFVGYKDSETAIDFELRDSAISREETYAQEGFFAGLGYGHTFQGGSRLNLSLAYVDLNSRNRFFADVESDDDDQDDEEERAEDIEFDDLEGDLNGSAKGYSVNLSWIMPLSETLAFSASYKINDYRENVILEGESYKADSTITFLTIGLLKAL